jgi:superfamily II DNA or RNA helicase
MAEVNRRIFIRKRDQEIARIINGYREKAVVFCASIDHAERMKASLKRSGTFHSQKGSNQQDTWYRNQVVLECLNDGTLLRVCAVNAFNEGVNVPSVGLVAFCRVTDTVTVFRQQLGRGLRPGKDKLVVLDFVGNLERIRLILEMVEKIKGFSPSRDSQDRHTSEKLLVSGAGFQFTFSDKVEDLLEVLRHVEQEFYPTWQEAGRVVRNLGIGTTREYDKRYKEDNRLPSNPNQFYSNFPGWSKFLRDEEKCELYPTWQQASEAAKMLGISSSVEYTNKQRYKEDLLLPSAPPAFYSDFPGWTMFLKGEAKKELYLTWDEAAQAIRRLGIQSSVEYRKRYKEDGKLPASLNNFYKDFPGWPKFLGKQ